MMTKAAEHRPGKINIATDKIKIKKTAEERALEMYVPPTKIAPLFIIMQLEKKEKVGRKYKEVEVTRELKCLC